MENKKLDKDFEEVRGDIDWETWMEAMVLIMKLISEGWM